MQATRKPKSRKHSSMGMDVRRYFRETQFHGAARLADGESSWYWVPSMLVLFVCAIALIYLTIKRFQENPTFMTQKEASNLILDFPSVIICPEVEFNKVKKEEFLSTMAYPDGLNKTYIYSVLPQLAAFYSPDSFYEVQDLENLEKILKHNNMDVETAGRRLTGTCEETLIRCRWNKEYHNCADMFRMELTGDGFCCVFNGRSLKGEMKERMLLNRLRRIKKWSTKAVGFGSGLILAVNQSQEPVSIDLSYKWIALQSPQRFVDVSINGTPLSPGSEQWMSYQMSSFYISDDAKDLRASLRKCHLPTTKLKYFPEYKKKYCILECEMANTIKRCNCVRIVHPKPRGVRYCGAKDHQCAIHAMVAYGNSCDCMVTCSLDAISIKSSSFPLDSAVAPIDQFYTGLKYDKVTIVRVFIQTREQWTFRRMSYYSHLEFFSQLGGIFNVFFGSSILTLLGIVQFAWKISALMWKNFSAKPHMKNK